MTKFRLSAAFATGAIAFTTATSFAAVTINELRIDQGGGDNDEYLELVGDPSESLNGLTYLVIGDGGGGSGTIEAVVDLTGNAIPGDGFLLVAESTFGAPDSALFPDASGSVDLTVNLNFENSDNVTHLLVNGFSGADGDDLDTDDDGTLDLTPWTGIADGLSLVENTDTPGSGEFYYGAALGLPEVGPDGTFVPAHVFRSPDGSGSFQIGEFGGGLDTPGAANVPEPSVAAFLAAALAFVGLRRRRA